MSVLHRSYCVRFRSRAVVSYLQTDDYCELFTRSLVQELCDRIGYDWKVVKSNINPYGSAVVEYLTCDQGVLGSKSEYDQVIPQSHTAD